LFERDLKLAVDLLGEHQRSWEQLAEEGRPSSTAARSALQVAASD